MKPLILLCIAAAIAAREWLRTYRRREINVRDAEARPPWPADEGWVELCNVDDVSVLFDPRSSGEGPPRLRLAHSSRTLLEAAPSHGPWLPNRTASGDPALDAQVAIGGHPLLLAAALDRATRQCLIKLFDESFAVDRAGAVSLVSTLTRAEILKECPELIKLAKSVSPRRLVNEHLNALQHNLHMDPVPEVRKRNLEVLLQELSADPAIVPLVREALQSPDPDTRLIAAELAAHRLDPTVVHLCLLDLARGQHAMALRVKAIELLKHRQASIASVRTEISKLLRDDSEQVRTAAFELLSARGWLPEGGTLSLAPTEGGELSLAKPHEGGELSVAVPLEPGRKPEP
jgi:hypothetical protein